MPVWGFHDGRRHGAAAAHVLYLVERYRSAHTAACHVFVLYVAANFFYASAVEP